MERRKHIITTTKGMTIITKGTVSYTHLHTVMEEAEMAFEHIFDLQASIERMNQELADRTDYDSENYHKLIEKFTHDNERCLLYTSYPGIDNRYRYPSARTYTIGMSFKF